MADPHFYAIVPAGPDDAAALAQVHVTAWRETYTGILPTPYLDRLSIPLQARRWRRRLTDSGEVTLLAEGPQGAVGYCAATWSRHGGAEHEAEVNTLYLLREAQGTGLGRALLTASVRVMAARGATPDHRRAARQRPRARLLRAYGRPARGRRRRLGRRTHRGDRGLSLDGSGAVRPTLKQPKPALQARRYLPRTAWPCGRSPSIADAADRRRGRRIRASALFDVR
jgi:GNAT superfamily N-acetyltransferase